MTRRAGDQSGFTLLEMLVVIAIISMLAGLLMTGVTAARRKAAQRRTSLMLQRIATAVENYELDFGDYPDGCGDEVSGSLLYIALTTQEMNGPYLELQQSELADQDFDGVKEIVDVWGHPIRYTHHKFYDGEPGRGKFRISSLGRDGRPDTRDDLTNWD